MSARAMSVIAKLRAPNEDAGPPESGREPELSAMDQRVRLRRITPVRVIAALLVIAAVTAGAFGYLRYGLERRLSVDADRVTVSAVTARPFTEYAPVTGSVVPKDTVYLPVTDGGQVTEIFVEEGVMVHAGQPLARLENPRLELEVLSTETRLTEQQNNLANARLALEQSELRSRRDVLNADFEITRLTDSLERYHSLVTRGAIAEAEVTDLEKELSYRAELKAMLERANESERALAERNIGQLEQSVDRMAERLRLVRATLDDLTLKAPISGQLTTFDIELGEVVGAGASIGQIDTVGAFKITALVDEFYLARIAPGQPANVEIGGVEYQLEIAKVYPNVRDRQFQVDIEFAGAVPDSLRRGQTVRPRIELSEAAEGLVVANGPFFEETGGVWAFVVGADGSQASRREISLGRRNPEYVEVLDGVEAGERVITSSYASFGDIDRIDLN